MSVIRQLYGRPHALLTDFYQLTMAYAHWRAADPEREAVFNLTFRKAPFDGRFVIAAGLDAALEYLADFRFGDDDIAYLGSLEDAAGQPMFPDDFLEYLRGLRFEGDLDAVPEGTAVFPHEPILRVRAPVLQAQMLETALLNLVLFPTLVATKAARMVHAAGDGAVLDFGLRKAHGIDGGVTAARAAYLGGCAATANVLAGRLFGIPVKGTHAHGWVMAFDDELEAFDRYAEAMPDNCIFLVDTYDSRAGIENAIAAGRKLRERGHEMVGIRLDSGDLGELAAHARRRLDEAGFPDARIAASSDLDEHRIAGLRRAGAPIAIWGVGTKLDTAQPDSALDGVYKLTAIRSPDGGAWEPRIKLSDTEAKHTNPGIQQVRRYRRGDRPLADVIHDVGDIGADVAATAGDIPADAAAEDLLVPMLRAGEPVYEAPPLDRVREAAMAEFASFAALDDYPVRLDAPLAAERRRLRTALGG
ncbi:nicotinate phosphoribosyltransferase [Salinisphaera sp. PC39]|uniref:nicotinate phosphoribosyltransferase n=1 Tax=Salinisphaera sp. PC39 TaxID=1304156 RepID=UPI003341E190